MANVPYTVENVTVGLARLYVAPANTALPSQYATPSSWTGIGSVLDLPDWPAPWVETGATEQGVNFSCNPKNTDIQIEEQSTPVDVVRDTMDVLVDVTFSEDTVNIMKDAYGSGVITTGTAGTGTVAYDSLNLSDTLDKVAVAFEALNHYGYSRRVYVPKAVSAATKVETIYRRSTKQRMYTAEFRAISKLSQIAVYEMTHA